MDSVKIWNRHNYRLEVDKGNLHFYITFPCIFIAVSITYETEIRKNVLEIKWGKIIMPGNVYTSRQQKRILMRKGKCS